MTPKKLGIVGISGRMGSEIRSLAPEFGFHVVAGVSGASVSLEGVKTVPSVNELDAGKLDILIDFSLPELTEGVLAWCASNRVALVSGVTGLTDDHKKKLVESSRNTAVLWSPNMSLGIAVMSRILASFSQLEDFEFQIEELHHKRKKDKPSGTALLLQERLQQSIATPLPAPVAIRGGGVFGIHRVWAMGEDEIMTVEHTAMNRRVFARGALKAANWILGKSPGLYRMDDVLGT